MSDPSASGAKTGGNDALARIASQDASQIHALLERQFITADLCKLMVSQLGRACGVSGPALLQLTQLGADLMRSFPTLSFAQQLSWLRADLSLREAIYAQDDRRAKSWNHAVDDASYHAMVQRMHVNRGHVNHLKNMVAGFQNSTLPTESQLQQTTATKAPVQASGAPHAEAKPLIVEQRPRLQSPSQNVKSEPTQLKRKREEVPSGAHVQILDDSSDDEGELQDQLEALQAKIAAIRARTSNEDELMATKKKRKTTAKGPMPKVSQSAARHAHTQAATTTQRSGDLSLNDPFEPPNSSQDVRRWQRDVGFASVVGPSHSIDIKLPSVKRESKLEAGRNQSSINPPPARPIPPVQEVVDLTSSTPPPDHPAVPTSEPVLCAEQKEVVDLILTGHNVFYTGSAGCGKSTVLKSFVPKLREQGKCVRIVAPTGKAALDINGSTTWTYAGWTPSHFKLPLEKLVKAAHGKFVSRRFRETDVLVIDEISMVENHLLQRLDAVMRAARGKDAPFGGVQLVVTGDFCQLPPVKPFQFCMLCGKGQTQRISGGKIVYRCPTHGDCRDEDKWAFRSQAWQDCKFKHINLSKIHRQKDETFIKILQKLRVGSPLTDADRHLLLNHPCDVTNAVKLFPRRLEVKRINDTEFDRLKTVSHGYTCLDHFDWNEMHGNLQSKGQRNPIDGSLEALREHRLESRVEYKVGMLVVLLVNLDIALGLVNGSQGRIVGFEQYDPSKLPKATVYTSSGGGGGRDTASQRKKAPGRPSSGRFASSKRRGRDDSLEPDAVVMGELRGEYALLREAQIRQFLERSCNSSKLWPVVEFDNGIKRTIFADCQINELGDDKPYTLLARTQIPLIAAWAMSIHKSQGMTLNRVIVDLGSAFEEGQEYVALSRARSLDGLKVVSLGAGIGKGGNEQVKEFLWQDAMKV